MRYVACLIFFFFALSSQAQVAYLYSDVDSVLIGETFDVRLVFSGLAPEEIETITWDTLEKLDHISFIDSQLYNVDLDIEMGRFGGDDYIFEGEEIAWDVNDDEEPPSFSNTLKLTVWELCVLGIPGPTVTFRSGQEITITPKFVFVKDPLMRDVEGLSPSEDIIREHRTLLDRFLEYWMLFTAIILFFILVPLAVWWSRRRRKEPQIEAPLEEVIEEPTIPAHITALEQLNQLKSNRVWEEEGDKIFVSKLTEIIREYIENRFGVKALEMTSQEITEAMQKDLIDSDQMQQLKQTLDVSDLIKFAKAKADANMYEEFVDDAIDLVDTTKEIEEKL